MWCQRMLQRLPLRQNGARHLHGNGPIQLRARDTRRAFADVLGEQSLRGSMLRTGPILELMDVLAGTISMRVAKGPTATISFDRVDLVKPVYHGDLVRIEGEVIAINNSSMSIQCSGFRHDIPTNEFQHTHSAIITMVAIDENHRPRKGLPELFNPDRAEYCIALRQIAEQRKQLSVSWRKEQADVDERDFIAASEIHQPLTKQEYVRVSDTEIKMRNWFLPRNYNVNDTLFGGDLLSWMDKAALYCANNFTKSDRMVTIAMNRILFQLPIRKTEEVALRARVCHVRRHRLEVEVEVFVENPIAMESRKSHTGYFTVLNVGPDNEYLPISKGLEVDASNQQDMKRLLKAQKRWEFQDEDQQLYVLDPLSLSI